jgi:hypothetical protein
MKSLLNNFFTNYEKNKFKQIIDIYISTISNNFLHFENIFLNLFQSLESFFYLEYSDNKKFDIEVYKKLSEEYNIFIEKAPSSIKSEIILQTNELSLKEKLEYLLNII